MDLRAFVGLAGGVRGARGNPCRVFLADTEPAAAPPTADVTQCISWRTDAGVAQVRCWTPSGHSISLCGHGLLCCGAAWAQRADALHSLTMNTAVVQFRQEGNLSWVGLPAIDSQPCPVPSWVEQQFGELAVEAATAGDDSGYLVLQWPAAFELRTLPIPESSLIDHTGRAVIVTCQDQQKAGDNIQYRYFAPQHGVAEDIATGSALRVLADYWHQRGMSRELSAQQCSAQGGELYSRLGGDITWVGGHVTVTGDGVSYAE